MRKVFFEEDEMRVISMFDTTSREKALAALENVLSFTR